MSNKSFFRSIIDIVLDQIKASIQRYVRKVFIRIAELLILVIIGVALLAVGAVFLLVGAVKWLSLFYPAWLAWDILGVIGVLVGVVLLLVLILMLRNKNLFRF